MRRRAVVPRVMYSDPVGAAAPSPVRWAARHLPGALCGPWGIGHRVVLSGRARFGHRDGISLSSRRAIMVGLETASVLVLSTGGPEAGNPECEEAACA
ncbi:hypothetical protein HDA32_002023 [Spinactinospora alkalitolerans]|uniref:Uncharacterized protein n=1 Tax=Spinactinospora alkalitolerans TaxID=687207 RepID=A0A852TVP6_9ACTN|nr:hypothetical protein [Spinactinospora alkalitolerans]